jgi:D-lactate dehydrogenase
LSNDPQSHLHNLQTAPIIEMTVDRCIQCGFCEPVCPSRNLTTTPRQRIALRREMARQPEGSAVTARLLVDYDYDAIQTCAGDSSCAIACPVDINTGTLMKHFRHLEHGPIAERVATGLAKHFGTVERAAWLAVATANGLASVLGTGAITALTDMARVVLSKELVPRWLPNMPPAARIRLPATKREGAVGVYFTACVNRIFGRTAGRERRLSLQEAIVGVSDRAGLPLWIPDEVIGHCCATIWHSKGYSKGNNVMANRVVEGLWQWSDGGRLPIVCDASSCSLGLSSEIVDYLTPQNRERHTKLTIIDSIVWAHDHLLPKLPIRRKVAAAVVHPSCSVNHLKLSDKLHALAAALAETAVTPLAAGCCAFAGDRGLLHAELTRSATADEAAEVRSREFNAYLGSNRTCEIGLNLATGRDYESFAYLLETSTRSATQLGADEMVQ